MGSGLSKEVFILRTRRLSTTAPKHCPSEINPADIPSRGASGDKLATNKLWWNGPSPEGQWPRVDVFPPSEITEVEVVKRSGAITHVLVSSSGSCVDQRVSLEEIIDCTKYSSFNKLLRVIGFVLKFKLLLQKCQQGEE